ncbi:protein YAE1 homolog isoform 1-T1 [Anomaloglossus baeobatrachus]|uniref:protein YAE1 homolog n=1 Tax=Anomaloglossus baeobatrachus TaxID=238106 RepID=UPI003F509F2C
MSWVRAAAELRPQGQDDVFDEEADEMKLLQNDWKKAMEKRMKEGYLDGVDAGKEHSRQTGFNVGYTQGASLLLPCGELRGSLSALITWCQVHDSHSSSCTQLTELLTSVAQCEDNVVKTLSSIHQVPHPSGISGALEDMDVTSFSQPSSEGSCNAGQNCCLNQESRPTSFSSCRTIQQLRNAMKHELGQILQDTIAVVQENNLPADLFSYLQTLNTKYSCFSAVEHM